VAYGESEREREREREKGKKGSTIQKSTTEESIKTKQSTYPHVHTLTMPLDIKVKNDMPKKPNGIEK
jgi:hypothetical protein